MQVYLDYDEWLRRHENVASAFPVTTLFKPRDTVNLILSTS